MAGSKLNKDGYLCVKKIPSKVEFVSDILPVRTEGKIKKWVSPILADDWWWIYECAMRREIVKQYFSLRLKTDGSPPGEGEGYAPVEKYNPTETPTHLAIKSVINKREPYEALGFLICGSFLEYDSTGGKWYFVFNNENNYVGNLSLDPEEYESITSEYRGVEKRLFGDLLEIKEHENYNEVVEIYKEDNKLVDIPIDLSVIWMFNTLSLFKYSVMTLNISGIKTVCEKTDVVDDKSSSTSETKDNDCEIYVKSHSLSESTSTYDYEYNGSHGAVEGGGGSEHDSEHTKSESKEVHDTFKHPDGDLKLSYPNSSGGDDNINFGKVVSESAEYDVYLVLDVYEDVYEIKSSASSYDYSEPATTVEHGFVIYTRATYTLTNKGESNGTYLSSKDPYHKIEVVKVSNVQFNEDGITISKSTLEGICSGFIKNGVQSASSTSSYEYVDSVKETVYEIVSIGPFRHEELFAWLSMEETKRGTSSSKSERQYFKVELKKVIVVAKYKDKFNCQGIKIESES